MSVTLAAARGAPLTSLASLGLAAWVGAALLTTAVVAPAAFAVLPTRSLAGALVGRVLPPLFASGLVLNALGAAAAWRDGERFATARLALCTLAAAACAMAQFVVARRIALLRAEIGPSLDALAAADPRRVAFGKLHGLSVVSLGVAMFAAAAVVALAAARPAGRNRGATASALTTHPG